MIADLWLNEWYYPELMHQSGLYSVQLLVATLLITPIIFLLKFNARSIPVARWLLRRRRNFGVASFSYALLHVIFYIREIGEFRLILLESVDLELATGWFAFAIFLVLAVTANEWSVRKLLRLWKRLHRWVYPAAAAIFVHWVLLEFFIPVPLYWFVPLIIARVLHLLMKRRLESNRRPSLAG